MVHLTAASPRSASPNSFITMTASPSSYETKVINSASELPPDATPVTIPPQYRPFLSLQQAEKQKFLLGTKTPSQLLYATYTPCGAIFDTLHGLLNKSLDHSMSSRGNIINRDKYQQQQQSSQQHATPHHNTTTHTRKNIMDASQENIFVTENTMNAEKMFEKGTAPGSQRLRNVSSALEAYKDQFLHCINQDENMAFYAIRERNMLHWMHSEQLRLSKVLGADDAEEITH